MTIKIEFPAGDCKAATALGQALLQYADAGEDVKKELHGDPNFYGSTSGGVVGGVEAVTEVTSTEPDTRVDANGVEFNADFCGEAKDPFYSSGRTKGQWKKRKGVSQADYDQWYEDSMPAKTVAEPVLDAGSVFAPKAEPAAPVEITEMGSLLRWVSEMQVAGKVTDDMLVAAYGSVGLEAMQDVFKLQGEGLTAAVVGIHTFLKAACDAQ